MSANNRMVAPVWGKYNYSKTRKPPGIKLHKAYSWLELRRKCGETLTFA